MRHTTRARNRSSQRLGQLLVMLALAILCACAYRPVPHLDYGAQRGIDVPAAPSNQAQVVFWVSAMNPKLELAIYQDDPQRHDLQLGVLRYATWFATRVDPGKHRFAVVSPQSADFTVGDLEAGKTYLLEAQNIFGERYRLQPVTTDMNSLGGPITNLMRGCFHVSPNSLTASESARLAGTRRQTLARYLEKWLTKPVEDRRRIRPEQAIDGPVSELLPQ